MISYIKWNSDLISKFILGTAQLGLNYGINNTSGKPKLAKAKEILNTFQALQGNCIDTAQAYGNAEKTIGNLISDDTSLKIISKLSPEDSLKPAINWEESLDISLKNFKKNCIWAFMNHREECLDNWSKENANTIKKMKSSKKISYFGVSVYDTQKAKKALEIEEIDFIQIPCNVWDQRMLREGIFEIAKQNNKICFVRSIYLQGALLLSYTDIKKKLPFASKCFFKWKAYLKEKKLNAKQVAMSFALSLNSPLVIGAETENQIKENASLFTLNKFKKNDIDTLYYYLKNEITPNIINPALW
jgi:aryl-alcohol dehydrogenase-like predicted oxidoreductase